MDPSPDDGAPDAPTGSPAHPRGLRRGRRRRVGPARSRVGTPFAVAALAVYLLHDMEHHLHDVAP